MKLLTIIAVLIGSLLNGKVAPSESELLGQWGCTGNRLVFMNQKGPVPVKADVDAHVIAMGATERNCVLSFSDGHKLNFRVGAKSFDLDWTLNPSTHEFKTTAGPFKISGYLVKEKNRLVMTYSRKDLFLIMRFLCDASGRKHISPLGDLLDCTEGLTVAMEFTKQ